MVHIAVDRNFAKTRLMIEHQGPLIMGVNGYQLPYNYPGYLANWYVS